jgi:FkbM family methyltransferase
VTLVNFVLNTLYGRNITIVTSEGSYFLRTTVGHPLKRYLRKFDKYDRFLPYLSKAHSTKCLIDIGANIGDTLVLVKSVSNTEVVCVEPDQQFIRYLKHNIELNALAAVRIYPHPISSKNKIVSVEKNALKSTSNMSEVSKKRREAGLQTKTFHDLINDLSLDINSVGIIKSDTDGYDWDCLNSIADYFDSTKHINYPEFIFYEHQPYLNKLGKKDPGGREREKGYQNSLRRLWKYNYTDFYIFNNFGSLVHRTGNLNELFSITGSLTTAHLKTKLSNYFLDILVARPHAQHIVENALRLRAENSMVIN